MARRLFITGNSSGLGLGLTEEYLDRGWQVTGLSRRGCPLQHPALTDYRCDIADFPRLESCLDSGLADMEALDLVVLNAGVLGRIREISDTPLTEIQSVMEINVWANKRILDWLISRGPKVVQVIAISSGAAINGNKGWGAYALSKAALNMLIQLYAHEMPASRLTALAPGLVDTAMQDILCDPAQVDVERFPTVQKMRDARSQKTMADPRQAAQTIADAAPQLLDYPSGAFVDIRNM